MLEALVSLVVATTLLLGSPGPAPLALAATGAVFGFRGGLPFLAGILSGLAVAIVLGSAGIVTLFEAFPASRFVVQTLGGLYIGYVAIKIASAPQSRRWWFSQWPLLSTWHGWRWAVCCGRFSSHPYPLE